MEVGECLRKEKIVDDVAVMKSIENLCFCLYWLKIQLLNIFKDLFIISIIVLYQITEDLPYCLLILQKILELIVKPDK